MGVVQYGGGLSTVPTGSQLRYSENPAFFFFSLSPTVGAYLYSYYFFQNRQGLSGVYVHLEETSEKSSAKHVPADQSGLLEPVEANQDAVLLLRQL